MMSDAEDGDTKSDRARPAKLSVLLSVIVAAGCGRVGLDYDQHDPSRTDVTATGPGNAWDPSTGDAATGDTTTQPAGDGDGDGDGWTRDRAPTQGTGELPAPATLVCQTKPCRFVDDGVFIVPSGVTKLMVHAWGGGGGSGSNDRYALGTGGAGGFVTSTLTVKAGEALEVAIGRAGLAGECGRDGGAGTYVGGRGGDDDSRGSEGEGPLVGGVGAPGTDDGARGGHGGFGGGGGGGGDFTGGGGGGATVVRRSGEDLLVAGGGGGGGGADEEQSGGPGGPGCGADGVAPAASSNFDSGGGGGGGACIGDDVLRGDGPIPPRAWESDGAGSGGDGSRGCDGGNGMDGTILVWW